MKKGIGPLTTDSWKKQHIQSYLMTIDELYVKLVAMMLMCGSPVLRLTVSFWLRSRMLVGIDPCLPNRLIVGYRPSHTRVSIATEGRDGSTLGAG